jgi:hypothetical protein
LFVPFVYGNTKYGEPPADYDSQYEEVVRMQQDLSAAMAEKEPTAGPKRVKPQDLVSRIEAVIKDIPKEPPPKRKSAKKRK